MVKIITSALIFAVVSFIVTTLGIYFKRHGETYSSTLRPPKIIFWIGISGCVLLLLIDVVLCILQNWEGILISIIPCVCFIPIYTWLILYALNWQIILKDDEFVFRNMFGKKKIYRYEDITAIKRIKIGGYRMYFGKKSIAVDYFVSGQQLLWDKIKVMNIPVKK